MKFQKNTLFTLLALLTFSFSSFSATEKYRLMFNADPSTTMVVGWVQNGGNNAMVHYDIVDHGTNWNNYAFTHGVDRTTSHQSMNHEFSRLTGLTPNTVYYFVVRDSDGVSARFSFKTLSNDPNIPLSIVVGGDSRTNPGARRNANKLVAKLRPDFVFFGGDYTELNLFYEWQAWFDDWQHTIAADGRMFPIVGARGNHEWTNDDVYKMFDTPNAGVYYALNFGGNLLRAYTLNSESAIPGAQTNWLVNDLQANEFTVEWKIAQYHKPMRPHVSSKSEGNDQYNNWAQPFYDYGVRLISESDAHTVKSTWKVKPSNGSNAQEGFERDNIFGSVYVGEGCWGAPLRSANDNKNWTRNSGVFNSFQWVKVTKQKIEVKYIGTDNADSVGSVHDTARFANPTNLDVWSPSNGDLVVIENEKYTARPFVNITAPLDGTGFPVPQTSLITANANDTNGTVTYVEFFVNDVAIGRDSTFPYSLNWSIPTNGDYVLTAWAVDNDGYHNISNDVRVFVGTIAIANQINSSNNDAEENKTGGSVDIISSDLEMVIEDNFFPIPDDDQLVGLRFTNLNIPSNATILSSYIQFSADGSENGTSNLIINGEKTGNSVAFETGTNNISSRTKTTASVNWNPPAWIDNDAGVNQQTPSLNNIIAEIISQPSWQIGNAMSFIIDGTGTRTADSYDGADFLAPILHITFEVNNSTSSVEATLLPEVHINTYPNPVTDILTINWGKAYSEVNIKLFASNGAFITEWRANNTNRTTVTLPSNIPDGLYFVKIASSTFEQTKRIIKQQ